MLRPRYYFYFVLICTHMQNFQCVNLNFQILLSIPFFHNDLSDPISNARCRCALKILHFWFIKFYHATVSLSDIICNSFIFTFSSFHTLVWYFFPNTYFHIALSGIQSNRLLQIEEIVLTQLLPRASLLVVACHLTHKRVSEENEVANTDSQLKEEPLLLRVMITHIVSI